MRVHGSYARVVEAGRYGERLFYLAVVVLHDECARAVHYALGAAMYGGGGVVGVNAVASGLGQHNLHARVLDVVVNGAGGVASASHASHEIVGVVSANLLLELPFQLF